MSNEYKLPFTGAEVEEALDRAKRAVTDENIWAYIPGSLPASDVPAWAKQPNKPSYTAEEVGARPSTWMPSAADVGARPDNWTPTAEEVGALTNESDPNVPDWAKQANKPNYTASEVGARPDNWTPTAAEVGARPADWMPTASEIGALTKENDPTVPDWAKAASKPTYTASEVGARPDNWTPSASDVGADKSGTAASAVSAHNSNTSAHNDIRLLIEGLTTRLNTLANSDDNTLDQMSEIVAYIKANRNLLDQITTGKVSVSDIANNLTTNASNKPLSAAQGVALKALIDAITVPTKVSQLTNDAKYLTSYTETDPTVPDWAKASSKPSYSKSEVGLGNVDNVKQYSASNPPPYPVTSVNGQTGAVTVSVPSKTSQLTNDSGFLTAHQSLAGYATETYVKNYAQPKGNYLTQHQDISGKADKSSAETWTFTLANGSTVTKKVVLA